MGFDRPREGTTAAAERRPASALINRSTAAAPQSPIQMLQRRIGNQALLRLFAQYGNELSAPGNMARLPGVLVGATANARSELLSQMAERSGALAPPLRHQPPGDSAGQRNLGPSSIQTKLTISHPGDMHEQEAERTADSVMRVAEPPPEAPSTSPIHATASTPVQRLCAECEEELSADHNPPMPDRNGPRVHREEESASVPEVSSSVSANIQALQGGGSPLPAATRAFFEPRLGADFSQVRVHTGTRAEETAKAINAKAFTVGSDIAFAGGQYAPESHEGQRLLAHELTHVVQQGAAARGVSQPVQLRRPLQGQSVTEGSQQSFLRSEGPAHQIPRTTTQAGSAISSESPKVKLNIAKSLGVPKIQTAWYNIDIPFTDYQFDPSLEGIKTAATVVKDTAVAGLEWIIDEIKSLVSSGIDWLSDKWNSIQEFASSAFEAAKSSFANIIGFFKNPLGFVADALMSLDAQALAKAWTTFSGLISTIANGFKALTGNLLQQVNKIWGGINGFATSLLNRVSSLTENFLFKRLPDALQRIAFTVIDRLKGLWKSINDGWTKLFNKIKAWIDSALDTVFSFVRKVLSFGINVVIAGIIEFGKIVLFLKDLFSNPKKYVELLAKRSVQAFAGVEGRFAGVVGQYFGSAKTAVPAPAATIKIQRQPASEAPAETKRSATWGEIGHGITETMGKKWREFKSNPLAIVTGLLMDMIFPIVVVSNIKDVIQLFKDIKKIVTGPLSAGSLEELWTSLLQILDIPILIYHTVVSILMRTLMVPLIVATFIPHPLVKGIAAAVGYALLGAFVQAEGLNLAQKVLLLKTGVTTKAQKEEAYNRIADSLIALAMTAVIIVIMLILHFIAHVMKGVYNFIKGKVFPVEPTPVEGKGTAPGKGKGGPEEGKGAESKSPSKDLGTQDGKKVLAEKPTADGKHQLKVTEEGVRRCSPSCPLLIQDIDAAVQNNPALKEKLDPLRKRLESAQGDLESARLRQDRAVNPEEAAKAAADVEKAAQTAADVAAEVEPQISKVIRDAPLPSGLRFNEYNTPEAAIGMREGRATPVGSDPIKNPALRDQGYTDRHYYLDDKGKKWSVDVREVEGKPVYKEGKPSSGQEFD